MVPIKLLLSLRKKVWSIPNCLKEMQAKIAILTKEVISPLYVCGSWNQFLPFTVDLFATQLQFEYAFLSKTERSELLQLFHASPQTLVLDQFTNEKNRPCIINNALNCWIPNGVEAGVDIQLKTLFLKYIFKCLCNDDANAYLVIMNFLKQQRNSNNSYCDIGLVICGQAEVQYKILAALFESQGVRYSILTEKDGNLDTLIQLGNNLLQEKSLERVVILVSKLQPVSICTDVTKWHCFVSNDQAIPTKVNRLVADNGCIVMNRILREFKHPIEKVSAKHQLKFLRCIPFYKWWIACLKAHKLINIASVSKAHGKLIVSINDIFTALGHNVVPCNNANIKLLKAFFTKIQCNRLISVTEETVSFSNNWPAMQNAFEGVTSLVLAEEDKKVDGICFVDIITPRFDCSCTCDCKK